MVSTTVSEAISNSVTLPIHVQSQSIKYSVEKNQADHNDDVRDNGSDTAAERDSIETTSTLCPITRVAEVETLQMGTHAHIQYNTMS